MPDRTQTTREEMRIRRECALLLDRALRPANVSGADIPARYSSRFSRQRNGHDASCTEDLYYVAQLNPAGARQIAAWLMGVAAEREMEAGHVPTLREIKMLEQETDGREDLTELREDTPAGARAWREDLEAHLPHVLTAIAACRRVEASATPARLPARPAWGRTNGRKASA